MNILCIDIGTNSVLSLICNIHNSDLDVKQFSIKTARLGRSIHKNGEIDKIAKEKVIQIVKNAIKTARSYNIDNISIVGTHALRNAKNSPEFLNDFLNKIGKKINIISPEEEINLVCSATKHSLKITNPFVILDIGAGSTEMLKQRANNETHFFSMPIGAMLMKQKFNDNPTKIKEEVLKYLSKESFKCQGRTIVGVGGTITTLALLFLNLREYDEGKILGKVISLEDIKNLLERLSKLSIADVQKLIPFDSDRADILYSGGVILETIMEYYAIDIITVNPRGLVYGLAYEFPKYKS